MGKGSGRRPRDERYCSEQQFANRWDQVFIPHVPPVTVVDAVLPPKRDVCLVCGARIPPIDGEGTCPACDPEGCRKHAERLRKSGDSSLTANDRHTKITTHVDVADGIMQGPDGFPVFVEAK